MDRMEEWELVPILSGLQFTDHNSWEQTRLMLYSLVSMFSKQEKSLTDVMTFPWESAEKLKDVEMSNDDKEKLRAKAEEIAKKLK